jgi:triacylglycerol lipase
MIMKHKNIHYPIVLAPGLFGFDHKVISYFLGIARYLERTGFQVMHTKTALARVERRAKVLKHQIEGYLKRTRAGKVNIIAHSMGGLDARYMISRLGMEDKVASLSTVGTPHRGTSIADWGTKRGGLIMQLLRKLKMDTKVIHDLTTESCQRFNEEVENAPQVKYFTYSGSKEKFRVSPFFWPAYDVIMANEGENDGLVSVSSARWGAEGVKYMGNFRADHLDLIGWNLGLKLLRSFNAKRFYHHVAGNIKEAGL